MDGHNERILLRGVVVDREGEPALDMEALVVPLDGDGPGDRLGTVVEVSELMDGVVGIKEDFGRPREAAFYEGGLIVGWRS